MENMFIKYMTDRFKEQNLHKEPGPVITLSREYGCYATRIAQLLADRLTKENPNKREWKWLSNEILQDAASKLEIDPAKITHIFSADEKKFMGDLIESFSTQKKYANDLNIKRTITTVVESYAEEGNIIIVGRAGCVIAKDIPRSLHVRLVAPFDWRAERIKERFNLTEQAAKKQVAGIDEKRKTFMNFFKGGDKPDCELFDLILNRSTLSEEDIVNMIMMVAKSRHFA
jgi:cytidylate kinase